MITVEEHRERILQSVQRIPPVTLRLAEAAGCVLAEDVRSKVALPTFDNSAMDGYAVRHEDVADAGPDRPVVLSVEGDIPAGDRRRYRLQPRRAYRIMTGAPIPEGADTVVPFEDTDRNARRVSITAVRAPGAHIRRTGEDVSHGDTVLTEGTRLGPRQLAILAASGIGDVLVTPLPRVVVISTGDELVEPGTVPDFGEVVDSNSLMLAAAVTELGGTAFRVSGVADTEEAVLKALRAQLARADAVVTSGGVSAGVYDAVKSALSQLGTVRFDQVAMQPGKPQGFGTIGRDVPVFTLPGNPVSALVSFEVFVAPALRVMAGRPADEVRPVPAVAGSSWRSPAGRRQYARVVLSRRIPAAGEPAMPGPEWEAQLCGMQGSHVLGGLAEANALAIVPAEIDQVSEGDVIDCLPLGPLPVEGSVTHVGAHREASA